MNTRYCSKCAGKNVWDLKKPRFCGTCGCDMDSAFAGVNSSSPLPSPSSQTLVRPVKTPHPARIARQSEPDDWDESLETEGGNYIDVDDAQRQTDELVASLKGQIRFEVEKAPVLKMSDLPAVKQYIEQENTVQKPRRSRKKNV